MSSVNTPMVLVCDIILFIGVISWIIFDRRAIRYRNLRRIVVLRKLDSALTDVFYGRGAPGTFEGWFLNKVALARKLGVHTREIDSRLNEVLFMAEEKGIYFSPELKEIEKQGPDALYGHIQYLKIP